MKIKYLYTVYNSNNVAELKDVQLKTVALFLKKSKSHVAMISNRGQVVDGFTVTREFVGGIDKQDQGYFYCQNATCKDKKKRHYTQAIFINHYFAGKLKYCKDCGNGVNSNEKN